MTDAALTALYERYGHLVFQRCLRLLGNVMDAEDAMHDVFLRVRSVPSPERSTLVWLYRVASNACIDRLRRQRLGPTRTTGSEVDPVVDVDPDRRALVAMVLRRVDRLTCEMGLLHHLDGLTQEEIAHECGYSRRTVGKKLDAFELEFKARWAEAGGA